MMIQAALYRFQHPIRANPPMTTPGVAFSPELLEKEVLP